MWQKHGNIKFRETTAVKADILVKFARDCHQDPFCFDKKGGTLAHAFYPYPGHGKTLLHLYLVFVLNAQCFNRWGNDLTHEGVKEDGVMILTRYGLK